MSMTITPLTSRTRLTFAATAALVSTALWPVAGQRGGGGGAVTTPAAPPPLSFPMNDPIIKRIWAIGMDSSHVEQLSQQLFDSIGPRLMGGPQLKGADDWLVKTYAGFGITAKEEQYGTWRGWRRGYSHIDLIAPRVRSLEGTMVGYSPGTGGKDLDAEPIILPLFKDSTEFVKWLPQAKGKLVLAAAPPVTCRPTSDWQQNGLPASVARIDSLKAVQGKERWSYRDSSERGTGYSISLGGGSLSMRLDKSEVAGLVTSRPKDNWGTMEIFETYSTRIPTIALSCEDYGLVFRLAQNNQHPKLRLNLDAQLLGEQPVFNTVARIPGGDKAGEYVVLSSHFDSWDGSSGATDNGTGTMTMLEAMRILQKVLPHPKRTIVSGHWSGEEEGEVGSKAFTEDHPEIMKGLQALFNQDNGTGRITRLSAGGIPSGAAHLSEWVKSLPSVFTAQAPFSGQVGSAPGGGSDDYSFGCYGAPTFGLGALSWDYNTITWHTDRDTYDKVVFDDLKSNATLTAMLAYLASEDPTFVTHINPDSARAAMAAARAAAVAAAGGDTGRSAGAGGRGAGAGGGGGRGRGAPTWPNCEKAPRKTAPRLVG